jgi:hypothetical protein
MMPLSAVNNGNISVDHRDVRTGRFVPGNPGGGRRRGSRNRLGEDFVAVLAEDFAQHGPDVIVQVRRERPDAYLKIVAGLLPKELKIDDRGSIEELTDVELNTRLHQLAGHFGFQIVPIDDAHGRGCAIGSGA